MSPFFFSLHLLDLVYRVRTLRVILRAVTDNGWQACVAGGEQPGPRRRAAV